MSENIDEVGAPVNSPLLDDDIVMADNEEEEPQEVYEDDDDTVMETDGDEPVAGALNEDDTEMETEEEIREEEVDQVNDDNNFPPMMVNSETLNYPLTTLQMKWPLNSSKHIQ